MLTWSWPFDECNVNSIDNPTIVHVTSRKEVRHWLLSLDGKTIARIEQEKIPNNTKQAMQRKSNQLKRYFHQCSTIYYRDVLHVPSHS
jgi:hypothetical protein